MELGIEADLILFHSYDRWGFSEMDAETDDRYLQYVVARWLHTVIFGGLLQTNMT